MNRNLCLHAALALLTLSCAWASESPTVYNNASNSSTLSAASTGTTPQSAEPDESSAHNTTNIANNPVTPKVTFEAQNYFSPSPQGEGGKVNDQELFRLYVPFKVANVQNILRFYQPVERNAEMPGGGLTAGLGDTTIYDLALKQRRDWTLGLGPLLVLPSGSHTNMTEDKFQAGGAGVILHEAHWGMAGAVLTYQHSFSNYGRSRPANELFEVQPQIRFNLKNHFYLRSTAFWELDWDSHVKEIPVGLGLGHIWTLHDGSTLNFYVEPQFSAYHTGTGSNVFQALIGLNWQLPKGEGLFGHHG